MSTGGAQHHVSGLAAKIRAVVDSETFDLAGTTASTMEHVLQDAFAEPFPLHHMIRITLIVGAGKLSRQKYDEQATKVISSTLQNLGFIEDRGASCVVSSAGTYKQQHDTGKNLKTVVIFPRILTGTMEEGMEDSTVPSLNAMSLQSCSPDHDVDAALVLAWKQVFGFNVPTSPEYQVAVLLPTEALEKLIQPKCPSWAQKKAALHVLDTVVETLQHLEQRLVQGSGSNGSHSLSPPEQLIYETVSMSDMEERRKKLREAMQQQVQQGTITPEERQSLLMQVQERIQTLEQEISEASASNSSSGNNKLARLQDQREKALQRKQKISAITPQPPRPLLHQAALNKLRADVATLNKVTSGFKAGKLLTLQETQTLAKQRDLETEICRLEEASRGWFESDDVWEARLTASRKSFKPKAVSSAPSIKTNNTMTNRGATKGRTVATNAWTTTAKPKASTKPVKGAVPIRGGGLFAAMMDDDSD